jgi:hypothetical protein
MFSLVARSGHTRIPRPEPSPSPVVPSSLPVPSPKCCRVVSDPPPLVSPCISSRSAPRRSPTVHHPPPRMWFLTRRLNRLPKPLVSFAASSSSRRIKLRSKQWLYLFRISSVFSVFGVYVIV